MADVQIEQLYGILPTELQYLRQISRFQYLPYCKDEFSEIDIKLLNYCFSQLVYLEKYQFVLEDGFLDMILLYFIKIWLQTMNDFYIKKFISILNKYKIRPNLFSGIYKDILSCLLESDVDLFFEKIYNPEIKRHFDQKIVKNIITPIYNFIQNKKTGSLYNSFSFDFK